MNSKVQDKDMVAIYFCSDLFAEPCGVSIVSMFENNKDFDNITVYIMEDNISDSNKKNFFSLAQKYKRFIRFINMPDPSRFFKDENFTISSLGHTFGRMIVGQLLPKEIDRVLCLDSDMLILNSLMELWNTDLENYYVAGVDSAPGIDMMKKTLEIEPGTLYCNGGLLLLNLKKIRDDNVEEEYKRYIQKTFEKGKKLGAYEEEVINKCCYPNIKRLDPKYNFMTVNYIMDYDSFVKFRRAVNYYSKQEMENAKKNPVIIHAINTFYVRKRIWEKSSDSPYSDEYLKYREMTDWNLTPQIVTKRSVKQKIMKDLWHIFPKGITYTLAGFARNKIRPLIDKKRDDE